MNVFVVRVSSPYQPQHKPDQASELFAQKSFVSRVADVNRLIDEKANFVMESARLHALAESSPEQRDESLALIQELEENIHHLQELIDRELKGLFYGLQKAPAPSPFIDELPG